MASFYEYQTDLAQKASGPVMAQAWSNGDPAVLAVSTGNNISCFLEEGERLEPDVSLSRNSECTVLSWHPRQLMFAYGWSDGTIGVWTEKERAPKDDNSVHKSAAITLIVWSPVGNRLITGDASGLIAIWSVDHRARIVPVCQYQKSGAITHCVFRAPAIQSLVEDAKAPCPPFFFGSAAGNVFFADDIKHCTEVVNIGAPVNVMYYSHGKTTTVTVAAGAAPGAIAGSNPMVGAGATTTTTVTEPGYLVLVSGDASLYKYKIAADGKMSQERKVKLSIKGDGSELQCVWAGSGLLAAANNEPMLRLWHQEKDLNYVLTLNDPRHGTVAGNKDLIRCVAFNPRKRVLAGGTHAGRIVMWRYTGGSSPSEDDWEILPAIKLSVSIHRVTWGPGDSLMAISSAETKSLSILNETILAAKTTANGNSVIQTSADRLMVTNAAGKMKLVAAGIRIKGMDLDAAGKYVLIYNGKRAEIREIKDDIGGLAPLSVFATRAKCAAVYHETVYAAVGARIEVLNFQGVVKKILTFSEAEGVPVVLDVWSDFLCVATSVGVVKLWNIKRAEPVQVVPGRSFDELGVIKSIRVNCNGTKISMLCNRQDDTGIQVPDNRVHVYEVETDKLYSHAFPPRYFPVQHFWDRDETKLFAVECRRMDLNITSDDAKKKPAAGAGAAADKKDEKKDVKSDIKIKVDLKKDAKADEKGAAAAAAGAEAGDDSIMREVPTKFNLAEVTTLFATTDEGILMQDSFAIDAIRDGLIGVDVPYVQFMYRPTEADDDPEAGDGTPRLKRRPMRDFVGLEGVNADTRRDLLNFSYQLTIGNMDEAYRAVKKISSVAVWENMAQMCVKTKRLDVAETCLGNMGNARGAKAVRLSKAEPERDAQVAMVAIQLGLLDDAERLYAECGRYDLLVELYMSCGRWEDALRVCAKHDRIHLKTVHYQYARHLEATAEQANAIKHYEKSDTHKHEVPRMLFDAQHLADLEAYIKASDDPALIKWWAQYCESNGSYDEAIRYYELAKERLALVRVYWYRGDDEKASEICTESGDAAACYHLARQYESQEKIKQAISFYTKAKRFNHGVRLAKEHGLENELLTLALESGSKELKVDAARYFEEKGLFDKAVLLYQKGGRIQRALQICFKAQLFDSLRQIAEELDANADPALLSRCGEFFLANKQYDKAVSLFVTARNFDQALELCTKHNVKVDEKLADKMTPPPATAPEEKKKRDTLLVRLATLCHDQRSYHLACKKFTQAGDKERAMKCLVKSDDTEKITAYASMTKNNAVYILAANHLQKLDWYNNAELMKTIISFYAKARAMRELSAFYDSCALHEIDDFRDYEKALEALREALKYAIKSKAAPDRDSKLNSLEARVKLVEKFVSARKLVKTNPAEMVKLCTQLLDTPDVESAVRVGDVYAELIQYYMTANNMQSAYGIIQRMRQANIVLDPYLDRNIVESIHAAVGVPMPGGGGGGGGGATAAAGTSDAKSNAHHLNSGAAGHGPNVMTLGDDGGGGGGGDDVGEAINEDVVDDSKS